MRCGARPPEKDRQTRSTYPGVREGTQTQENLSQVSLSLSSSRTSECSRTLREVCSPEGSRFYQLGISVLVILLDP